ncbi:hypothetical protein LPJ59_006986 [Coemansia sp. RSA 2399]|nr:hypothetical protein LPJ59_006986 [Coemansia sp. RSA 2399]
MLDDWESLLYLVCWYGTFGINNNCTDQKCCHDINEWCAGSDNKIADQKRLDLSTVDNFGNRIVNDFGKHDSNDGDSEILKGLATDLHMALFFNLDLDSPYHGTQIPIKMLSFGYLRNKKGRAGHKDRSTVKATKDAEPPSEPVDPFEMRVKREEDIAEELLNILEYYAGLARSELQEGR